MKQALLKEVQTPLKDSGTSKLTDPQHRDIVVNIILDIFDIHYDPPRLDNARDTTKRPRARDKHPPKAVMWS